MCEIAGLVVVAFCAEMSPPELMVVVAVPPIARVFAEMADVEALTKVTFDVVRTFWSMS